MCASGNHMAAKGEKVKWHEQNANKGLKYRFTDAPLKVNEALSINVECQSIYLPTLGIFVDPRIPAFAITASISQGLQ